jgi:hypothetical protein
MALEVGSGVWITALEGKIAARQQGTGTCRFAIYEELKQTIVMIGNDGLCFNVDVIRAGGTAKSYLGTRHLPLALAP